VVNNVDTDTEVTYTFEVSEMEDFQVVTHSAVGIPEGDGTTSWFVDISLTPGTVYFWHARAESGSSLGEWMEPARFFVGEGPSLKYPPRGAHILYFRPGLTIIVPETAGTTSAATFTFEIYGDESLSNLITTATIPPATDTETVFHVPLPLPYGQFYWWRVSMNIPGADSLWSETSYFFIIDPENDARNLTAQFVNEIENGSLAMSGWTTNSPYYNMERSDLIKSYSQSESRHIDYTILYFREQSDFLVEYIDAVFMWIQRGSGQAFNDHGIWVLTFVVEDNRWKIYSSFFYEQ
jgi:hypothetical protein